MSGLEADKLDLGERARQLEREAQELRNSDTPSEYADRKREANEDLDRRLREPLEKLRKIARE